MVMKSGIVSYFVFEQLDNHRKDFEGLTLDALQEKIKNSDKYYNAFGEYLAKSGLVLPLEKHKDEVKYYLTAEFARQLFSEKVYYQMLLKRDVMIKEVLK